LTSTMHGAVEPSESRHYLETELETLLREDKLMFEFFQHDVVDGLWYWDLVEQENEWMSQNFWRLFGYDPHLKEHKTSEWQDLIFPEDLEACKRNLKLHLRNPDFPYDQTVRYYHKNGSTIWVRCKGVAIYNAEGNPIRMLGCHIDLTRLMRKQQDLMSLKIRHEHAQRRLDEVESTLSQLKSMNKDLAARLRSERAKDDFGFTGAQHFLAQTHSLMQTAHRCDLPLNTINLNLESTGDRVADAEAKGFVARAILPLIAGGVCYQFSNDFFGVIALSFSGDQVDALRTEINRLCEESRWLYSRPEITISYRDIKVSEHLLASCKEMTDILDHLFY
jgi:PAS domain S-box-containing protein